MGLPTTRLLNTPIMQDHCQDSRCPTIRQLRVTTSHTNSQNSHVLTLKGTSYNWWKLPARHTNITHNMISLHASSECKQWAYKYQHRYRGLGPHSGSIHDITHTIHPFRYQSAQAYTNQSCIIHGNIHTMNVVYVHDWVRDDQLPQWITLK